MIMYKLCADHPVFGASNTVIRLADGAAIPFVNDNTDYQEYLKWIAEGNQPESAE
jgi:hypothetical protein